MIILFVLFFCSLPVLYFLTTTVLCYNRNTFLNAQDYESEISCEKNENKLDWYIQGQLQQIILDERRKQEPLYFHTYVNRLLEEEALKAFTDRFPEYRQYDFWNQYIAGNEKNAQ